MRNSLRKLTILVALLVISSTLLAIPSASAQSATRDFGAESGFLASLNSQRAAAGLAPLTMNASMSAAADGWTLTMTNGSFLAHAGDIVSGTPAGWSKVGENVGRGQSVQSLTSAFMASPLHRANIMDASYTHIGIAVYNHPTDGRMYTTHRFAALPSAAPVAAPAAAPATAVPATPVPATPTAEPTATAVPATPVPATPTAEPTATATAVPPTPVPATPTAEPTATAVPPTPVPPTPVPPTPAPPTPTAEPTATAVPPTAVPASPTAEPTATTEADFGTPPEQLAFVDTDSFADAARAKLESKTAKFSR